LQLYATPTQSLHRREFRTQDFRVLSARFCGNWPCRGSDVHCNGAGGKTLAAGGKYNEDRRKNRWVSEEGPRDGMGEAGEKHDETRAITVLCGGLVRRACRVTAVEATYRFEKTGSGDQRPRSKKTCPTAGRSLRWSWYGLACGKMGHKIEMACLKGGECPHLHSAGRVVTWSISTGSKAQTARFVRSRGWPSFSGDTDPGYSAPPSSYEQGGFTRTKTQIVQRRPGK